MKRVPDLMHGWEWKGRKLMKQHSGKGFRSLFLFVLCLLLMSGTAILPARAEEGTEPEEAGEITETEEPEEISELTEEPEELEEREEDEDIAEAEEDLEESVPVSKADKADYTIMMYFCGSDLESALGGSATSNIRQILESSYSKGSHVRFLVLLGGTSLWRLTEAELLDQNEKPMKEVDANRVSYWEVYGADAENEKLRSKLKFIQNSADQLENTSNSETLKKFINWGVSYAQAERYGLILWDHGSGPKGGFANDELYQHNPEEPHSMNIDRIADALKNNEFVKGGSTFEFIDFDTCLMGNVEATLAFSDYTKYYIGSPETESALNQDYRWLDDLGRNLNEPELREEEKLNGYDIGRLMVDYMIDKYVKLGRGETTLTVVNNQKLRESRFADTMLKLTEQLKAEAREKRGKDSEYLFYDEFSSVYSARRYGGDEEYWDLGNLMQKITIAEKEITLENIKEDDIVDTNAYTDIVKPLYGILADQNILYGRATKDIRSMESFFRDENGDVRFTDLPPSGLFIYFPPADSSDSVLAYADVMKKTVEGMKDGPYRNFLDAYYKTAVEYALISDMGQYVSSMSYVGRKPETINFDSLKTYVRELSPDYWDDVIAVKLKYIGGETDANKAWLNAIIDQHKQEVIQNDNVTSYNTKDLTGNGYRITIDGIRKRMVDQLQMILTAELPAAQEYLKKYPDIRQQIQNTGDVTALKIAVLNGEVERDIEPGKEGKSYYEEYIRWLNERKATWTIAGFTDSLPVIQDAAGGIHIIFASPIPEIPDSMTVPAVEELPDGKQRRIDLIFQETSDGNGRLRCLDITNGNASKTLFPSELGTASFTVRPVTTVRMPGEDDLCIPISKTSFTITKENADSIILTYKSASKIPDISTESGKPGLTRNVVVRTIYGYKFNINDEVIDNPKGTLTSIKLAEVPASVYNGKVQNPIPEIGDTKLNPNTDFTVQTAGEQLKNAGTYKIILSGKGSYFDELETEFEIQKADIRNTKISGINNAEYTGKAIEPKPVVTLGDVTLKEGTDYKLSYKNNVNIGEATVTITGINNLQGSVPVTFNIVEVLDQMEVYRMYNPNSGEHFYTSAKEEKEALEKAGWKYEGIAFHSLSSSSHPLYRVYNPNAGDHHYTESTAERDHLIKVGWKEEGIAFYVTDQQGGVPLYRLYNPNAEAGAHHYTASVKERDFLITAGWKDEGVGFYAMN